MGSRILTALALLAATGLALRPILGRAAPTVDRAPPSLALSTDAPVPEPAAALTTDALGPVFSEYGVELEIAVGSWQSAWISPRMLASSDDVGYGIDAGLRIWPLAEGLRGPNLGAGAGLSSVPGSVEREGAAWRVALDGGWQFVWEGLVCGLGLRLVYSDSLETRLRLAIGYAWL